MRMLVLCNAFIAGNSRFALLVEGPLDQPGDDREVAPFIVGRQDDRVLVLGGSHFVFRTNQVFWSSGNCLQDKCDPEKEKRNE